MSRPTRIPDQPGALGIVRVGEDGTTSLCLTCPHARPTRVPAKYEAWNVARGYHTVASPLDCGRRKKLVAYVERLPTKLRVPVLRSAPMTRAYRVDQS